MQFVAIIIVYIGASAAFAIPAVLDGSGQLGSALVAVSAIVSMALALAVAWLFLRREGNVAEAFRLQAPANWRSTLGWAALGTGGTIVIFTLGAQLTQALGLGTPDPSFVLDLVTESPALFALWIVAVAWFAAGFGEEMLYRGFLMDRLERLPGLRGHAWLVLVVQALLFGLPHAYQGLGGMVVTATVGLLFGWIRNRCGGNLWAAIIAHATVDTVMMSLAYADRLGWYGG